MPSSFKASLNFAGAVFELEGASAAAHFARVRGLVDQHLLRRPEVRQAAPLTVDQVKSLQLTVVTSRHVFEKVFAGYCLFTLLARGRWSDGMNIFNLSVDPDGHGGGFTIEL